MKRHSYIMRKAPPDLMCTKMTFVYDETTFVYDEESTTRSDVYQCLYMYWDSHNYWPRSARVIHSSARVIHSSARVNNCGSPSTMKSYATRNNKNKKHLIPSQQSRSATCIPCCQPCQPYEFVQRRNLPFWQHIHALEMYRWLCIESWHGHCSLSYIAENRVN